jgi:hypothetical protein
MTDSSRRRTRLARRLSWLVVGAMAATALLPVSVFAVAGVPPGPNAVELVAGPITCAAAGHDPAVEALDLIVTPLADGTYGVGGVVIISNALPNSFDWRIAPAFEHIWVTKAVIVTGDTASNVYLYQGGAHVFDTELTGPDNVISQVEFCFDHKIAEPTCEELEQCPPPPCEVDCQPPPPPPPQNCQSFGNCPPPPPTPTPTPAPTPTPTPAPTPTPTPSATPDPTGSVAAETGTPSVTLPPTDSLSGSTSAPSGDSWRLILLAMAGFLAAALLLTPTHAVVRRKDR